jgi:hypothetical protein
MPWFCLTTKQCFPAAVNFDSNLSYHYSSSACVFALKFDMQSLLKKNWKTLINRIIVIAVNLHERWFKITNFGKGWPFIWSFHKLMYFSLVVCLCNQPNLAGEQRKVEETLVFGQTPLLTELRKQRWSMYLLSPRMIWLMFFLFLQFV